MDQHPYFNLLTVLGSFIAILLAVDLIYLGLLLREKALTAAVDRRAAQANEDRNRRFDAQAEALLNPASQQTGTDETGLAW